MKTVDQKYFDQILDASSITGNKTLNYDVCIIGSGAGGAIAASVLAKAGAKVVIVEEGALYTKKDFTMGEGVGFSNLYQDRMNRTTVDRSFLILQGRTVGGSTTVNLGTSTRLPRWVFDTWVQKFGFEEFGYEDLEKGFAQVEERLAIRQVSRSELNRNNQILFNGAEALSWDPEVLSRNAPQCIGLGFCSKGCPVNGRRSMHLSYLLDAIDHGTMIISQCRVQELVSRKGKISEVRAVAMNNAKYEEASTHIRILPETVILAAGAINSPALLLRSNLLDQAAVTGKKTYFHPMGVAVGVFEDPVEPYYGIPQGVSVYRPQTKASMASFIEANAVHPRLAAVGTPGYGAEHRRLLERFPYMSVFTGHLVDSFHPEEGLGGTISLSREGKIEIRYQFSEVFWRSMRAMLKDMARIFFHAGAKEVFTAHERTEFLRSINDIPKIDRLAYGPNHLLLISTHPLGGCSFGSDPLTSVIRGDLRHWSYENLYIMDGSIFPTSLGVNPQETIMAFVLTAAKTLAKK